MLNLPEARSARALAAAGVLVAMTLAAAAPLRAEETTVVSAIAEAKASLTTAEGTEPGARTTDTNTTGARKFRNAAPKDAALNADRGGLKGLVARHAAANGVPFALAHAVIMVESRYNPRAKGGSALGLMQIKYTTARGMGYRGSAAGLFDPDTNLTFAMKYLAGAYRQAGGDTCRTVSKYQGGYGVRGVTRAGAVYCAKVRKHMASTTRVAAK